MYNRATWIQQYVPRAAIPDSERKWPLVAGGRRIQGRYTANTVVGTLQKLPAKAGGRSPKGSAVAGTTVKVKVAFI